MCIVCIDAIIDSKQLTLIRHFVTKLRSRVINYLIPSSSTGCIVLDTASLELFFIYTLEYPVGETPFISLEVRTIQIYHPCHVVVP